MAGYLGTKAVLLSTTAATVSGNATVSGDLTVDTDTLYVDSTNNQVGIGTTSPSYALSVAKTTTGTHAIDAVNNTTGAGSTRLILRNPSSDTNGNGFQIINNANDGVVNLLNYKNTPLAFWTNASERMRIDSSGHLLVAKTAAGLNQGNGIALQSDGQIDATADGRTVLFLDRRTSDGEMLNLRKDGTTVGSIGSVAGDLFWSGASGAGIRAVDATNRFYPCDNTGTTSDNTHDWGYTTARFDDIYATNGTIQTSDRNEKQDIRSLTSAEVAAAQELATQGVIYRWIDAVEKKGEEARQHSGHIAQDVKATLEKHGLDAFDYAFMIYSQWTDEETGEEKERYGLRYAELHSFIMAGSAQFVSDLAARVAALEAK